MEEKRESVRVGLVSEVQVRRLRLEEAPPGGGTFPDRSFKEAAPRPSGQQAAPEASPGVAWGADLSEGGIGLLLNDSLQVGDEIALQIAAQGFVAPISLKGLVVWAKAAKPGLHVGVRFREVEALAGAQILQLVTERLARLSALSAVQSGTGQAGATAAGRLPLEEAAPRASAQAGQAVAQPANLPATPKPIRVRPPVPGLTLRRASRLFATILLAVAALALLLQNAQLRRTIHGLEAAVASLRAGSP